MASRPAFIAAALLLSLSLQMQASCAAAAPVPAQASEDQTSRQLGERLFPVLSALDPTRLPVAARQVLQARRQQREACGEDAACVIAAARWSGTQITALTSRVAAASADDIAHELSGLNVILAEYGQGHAPLYPAIDGPRGAPGSDRLAKDARTAVQLSALDAQARYSALDSSISLAVALLDANDRLDAIRAAPLDAGLNAPAFARAQGLAWQRWPHTALIVLGSGPADDQPLSAISKLRVKLAAQLYAAGQAPYIIVSGGAVHPRGTRTVEAEEMRKALLERFGIPAEAVVMEPQARHTTTNVRNAARLLYRLHAPEQRDALVVSSTDHIDYVAGPRFSERLRAELGELPGQMGARFSANAIAFRPAPAALRVNPADPLDP